jgi:ubiquinone/menaquinone biosynthesis C-methylase UbiE
MRYRPRYPRGLIDLLQKECGLAREYVVADVGAGTGILTELFLQNGNRVYGVEPNDEMRGAAESQLHGYPLFTSVAATAEATSIVEHSVNMITVAQAFHWFKHDLARQEFKRILTPKGWVVLVWNLEKAPVTPFDLAFEKFWQTYLDPNKKFGRGQRPDYITNFFGEEYLKEASLENPQVCDYETFRGRILSSSYSPRVDDPRYPLMLAEIKDIFDEYKVDEKVTIAYETRIIYGHLER